MVELNCLGVYWNSCDQSIASLDTQPMIVSPTSLRGGGDGLMGGAFLEGVRVGPSSLLFLRGLWVGPYSSILPLRGLWAGLYSLFCFPHAE